MPKKRALFCSKKLVTSVWAEHLIVWKLSSFTSHPHENSTFYRLLGFLCCWIIFTDKDWIWDAAITDIDYYGSLGIQKGCSNDQVSNQNFTSFKSWNQLLSGTRPCCCGLLWAFFGLTPLTFRSRREQNEVGLDIIKFKDIYIEQNEFFNPMYVFLCFLDKCSKFYWSISNWHEFWLGVWCSHEI